MKGQSSVLLVKDGMETLFEAHLRSFAEAVSREQNCLYIDFYYTKHKNRFLLVEMHKNDGDFCSKNHLDIFSDFLTRESRSEAIAPVYSFPSARLRGCLMAGDTATSDNRLRKADEPLGVFVTAHIFPNTDRNFLAAINRVGEKITAAEADFIYADMYQTDTPQRCLMVELYASKAALWDHQDYQHSKDFAQEKKQYEASKLEVFTIRPAFSLGPLAHTAICQ